MTEESIKMKRFPHKRILITGAGSGLGRALSVEFAKMGWKIAVAEINRERAKETADLVNKEGGQGIEVICDVTSHMDLENAADLVKREWGGIDILVNNAGVASGGYFEKTPLDEWEKIFSINLKSVIYGCRVFIPMMKNNGGGYIVNVASNAGLATLPEMGSYNVTKAGVVSLSETLRLELSPHHIGVSVVCPSFFKTNLMDNFISTDERQRKMAEAMFEHSTYTAGMVAGVVVKSIMKNRFYIIPQFDGKMAWRFKRFFPELYFKAGSFVYRTGLYKKLFHADIPD
jgi:NAD(P)-dependent dehydrogenase (short-subunit alcohol dehydrogenase family)